MFGIKLKMIHKWTNRYIKSALKNGDLKANKSMFTVKLNGVVQQIAVHEFVKKHIDYDIEKLSEMLDEEGIKIISDLRCIYSSYAVSKWNSLVAIMISIIATISCEVFFRMI